MIIEKCQEFGGLWVLKLHQNMYKISGFQINSLKKKVTMVLLFLLGTSIVRSEKNSVSLIMKSIQSRKKASSLTVKNIVILY